MHLEPPIIGIIGFILMLILIFLRIPVAYTMIFVGFVGFLLINGLDPAMHIMENTFYQVLQNESYMAIPLFILMGYFAYNSGIITNLFDTAKKWVGHTPGGLAQATIVGGAGLGAATGSGISATATLAKIAYPQMINSGVDKRLAYGVIASAGPLACLIPPSVLLIIFAIVTQQSIGTLLIAGIIPGLFTASIYMLLVYILVKRNPSLAISIDKFSMIDRFRSLKQVWPFLLLVLLIFGGLYAGIFTPTESGAMGCFIVFIMLLIFKGFNWEMIKDSLFQTISTTGMIFLLICSSQVFSYFASMSRVPNVLSNMLTTLPVAPIVIMLGIIILYIVLGMVMDMVSAMFMTLPIIFPTVVSLGYDPIWFGVILVFLVELAMVTPPFGLSLFIIKGEIPESDMGDIYKGTLPFTISAITIVLIFLLFPQIITFLPSLM